MNRDEILYATGFVGLDGQYEPEFGAGGILWLFGGWLINIVSHAVSNKPPAEEHASDFEILGGHEGVCC